LEEDVRHRRRFPDDEQAALLEKEASESALERPTISDDRGTPRRSSHHVPAPPHG
jgi:hypothetical protein